jgi:hypothetical protein
MTYEKTQQKKIKIPALKITALIVFCVGVSILISGVHTFHLALNSRNWPETSGTVTQSELRNRLAGTSEGEKTISTYTIAYEYTVRGNKYTGSTVAFGKLISPEAAVGKYRPGKNITVFYDAKRPSKSVLEPGSNMGNYLGLLFGIVIMGLSFLIKKNSPPLVSRAGI